MAEKRLFGNSIDESIVKELKKREILLSKVNASNTDILPNDLQNLNSLRYTTQKGAWVRMISSVDVKEPASNTFSPEVSKNFILTGGELTSTGVKKEGISFDSFDTTKSYRKTETLGVRPEAGITSFSIKHKGTYGSLRDAEISFNVWSKEDLNDAQNIYLRPGIHMIVEWGHTIDSNMNPVILPATEGYFIKSTRGEIQEIINKHRKENLSYEGFIGLVTNFSWSFREDGGYDCSVKIVSAGAILESLTVISNNQLTTSTELKNLEIEDPDLQITARRSELHLLHIFLQKIPFGSIIDENFPKGVLLPEDRELLNQGISVRAYGANIKGIKRFPERIIAILERIPYSGFNVFGLDQGVTGANQDLEGSKRFRYINLRHLFAFLNESKILPNDTERTKLIELDSTVGNFFRTLPEHFSLDPGKVLLPKAVPPSLSNNSFGIKELNQLGVEKEFENTTLENITPPGLIPEGIKKALGGQIESTNILDIYVELGYVINIFDKFLNEIQDSVYSVNVFSFLQELLKGINYYLGNINDLDLHFDDSLQKYTIVDRELMFKKLEDGKTSINELSISGLSNTVSKVSLQTRITPLLSSQIAISAQGSSTMLSGQMNSNLPLIQWNENIQDRFNKKVKKPKILSEGTTAATAADLFTFTTSVADATAVSQNFNKLPQVQTSLPSYVDSFLIPINNAYFKYRKFTQPEYNEQDFQKLHSKGVGYFRERIFIDSLEDDQGKTSDPGLIPIELSITLDGIGGLKIAEVFKLNQVDKFLPDVYKDYGFIITGLDNAIENNKWNTTIRALTFKLPK